MIYIYIIFTFLTASLFLRGRGKVVYILPSSDPTLALLLVGFTEYDDDDLFNNVSRLTPLPASRLTPREAKGRCLEARFRLFRPCISRT
ncbi:hypothetical protein Hanom_Chr11g00995841 [Helianthus anomalus]